MKQHVYRLIMSPVLSGLIFVIPFLSLIYALYAQYALNDEPCVLCIHIRIYVVALMLVGILGLVLRSTVVQLGLYWLAAVLSTGLAFKCWELYGVEKGFIESSCFIDAGLPAWFNLERWWPALFEVRGLCGQSPEVVFGWSMAQMLMPASIVAALIMVLAAAINTLLSAGLLQQSR